MIFNAHVRCMRYLSGVVLQSLPLARTQSSTAATGRTAQSQTHSLKRRNFLNGNEGMQYPITPHTTVPVLISWSRDRGAPFCEVRHECVTILDAARLNAGTRSYLCTD